MLIPNSIPAWYTIIQKAKKYNLDININVDPFSGKQTGHMFFENKAYAFALELYPKNMIFSLKHYNEKLLSIWCELLEEPYRVLYQANTEYPYHAEWYFDCEEHLIQNELNKLKASINIKILKINENK